MSRRMLAVRLAVTLVIPAFVALTASPARAASFSPASVAALINDINVANGNNEPDVIDLGGNTFTLTAVDNTSPGGGPNGLPVITGDSGNSLTITNGTIQRSNVDGTPDFRILQIDAGDVNLTGVNVAHGVVSASGGALYNAGSGTLTLTDSRVERSRAGQVETGGGIHSDGPLTVTNTAVSGNRAGIGGGIAATDTLVVAGSAVDHNTAPGGGSGIYSEGAVTVTSSTVSDNNNEGGLGGGSGGGLSISGSLELTNSTVSGNVTGNVGGGIYLESLSAAKISNSTIVDNSAGEGANILIGDDVVVEQLHSTIIAGPQGGGSNCEIADEAAASATFNLDADGSCGMVDGANGNQVGTSTVPLDPLLGPLANNGGPTETHELLAGSPAIDAGVNPLALEFDQRGSGFVRAGGSQTDIGAFEVQPPDTDEDDDGIDDADDNCPAAANSDQADTDSDDIGDVCDPCTDTDGDGVGDAGFDTSSCPTPGEDNCAAIPNPDQTDEDSDGLGNDCDECPAGPNDVDSDADGTADACDPCPNDANDTCDNEADLSISKDDGVTSVTAGGSVTYTIAATNAGPDAVTGATVDDTFPAELTDVSWSCVGTDGGTCTAAGNGSISDTVGLPVTGSVTYTVHATVSPSASGSLSNTAKITPPNGTTDPDPEDATDTDTDTIVVPDSDGDGLDDQEEVSLKSTYPCLSAVLKDSDGDGIGDGQELAGLSIKQYYSTNGDNPRNRRFIGKVKTQVCRKDTDGDGLTDGQEAFGMTLNQRIVRSRADGGAYVISRRKTNPVRRDTDADGLTDKVEVTGSANWRFDRRKSDPTSADTDWGGNGDGREVIHLRSDPTRAT